MAHMATLKQAAEATGLSAWELRTGAKAGRYPHIRVGNPDTGKLLFDLDLLNAHIQRMMTSNLRVKKEEFQQGIIRQIR